jgi:hypothetical protein
MRGKKKKRDHFHGKSNKPVTETSTIHRWQAKTERKKKKDWKPFRTTSLVSFSLCILEYGYFSPFVVSRGSFMPVSIYYYCLIFYSIALRNFKTLPIMRAHDLQL